MSQSIVPKSTQEVKHIMKSEKNVSKTMFSGVKGLMGRVQWAGSVGPLGLGLGIRSSPYLGE
jgi:hypothetical protein